MIERRGNAESPTPMTRAAFLRLSAGAIAACALGGCALQSIASPAMRTRAIPSTGEPLPVIGLGTYQGFDVAPGSAAYAQLPEVLRALFAAGGSVIDSSPMYGRAEATTGELLAASGSRSKAFLATKVWTRGHAEGLRQIEESLRLLRADPIDLMHVHNLRDIANELAILRELKAAGRIRYVGATTSFERQYEAVEAMMRRETLDAIQIDYAPDNRKAGERVIPLAMDRGMAVFINLPFGRGRVFRATEGKPLPAWAAEIDAVTWPQLVLKYIVSNPAVTCAVPGMAQVRYVDDNMKAAEGRLPDAAMRRRMEQFFDAL